MSDTSQGPGWWKASDGKWYAPELHPDAAAQRAAAEREVAAQAAVATPPAANEPSAAAMDTGDHIVATAPAGAVVSESVRRGSSKRELVLVALAAFLLGGLAGFGGSRLLAEDAAAPTDANNSPNVATVERETGSDDRGPVEEVAGAGDRAADREAQSDLRRALTAAKTLATDWEGRWSVDAVNTPIDAAALSREDSEVEFGLPGSAGPGVVSVRVESVDAPNSDIWLAGGSRSGTFYCIHATSAGNVFFGTGTSEDEALAKCVEETW